ncbi:Midasin [Hexamita inflata]|uniref:Midasin n=1 Tax=Hexamita inflata TaxID=28002 RepID=A0AA86P620_9EUKA|nr:Midasin [Hexamita inflata]
MSDTIFSDEDQPVLNKLQSLFASKYPIAMVGPVASGRTTFATYYSHNVTGQAPITISLQNAQDARDIFGQYTCGQLPGQFVFHEGILLNAIRSGRVILLRNAELMQVDVFSALDIVLQALCNNQNVIQVQQQQIEIHDNFRLLMTCTEDAKLLKTNFSSRFIQIKCASFSKNKIKQILALELKDSHFNKLLEFLYELQIMPLHKLITVCRRLYFDFKNEVIVLNQQYINTQDLSTLPQQSRYIIIQEIYDAYLASLTTQQQTVIIQQLALYFKLDCFMITEYFNKYKFVTEVSLSNQQFISGRFKVPRTVKDSFQFEDLKNFALTNYTTRIIQQVVGCVCNRENVLLISSTGIGKTYTLDVIARALGNKLLIINFSGQTEISDLTGGYKPVNLTQLLNELYTLIMQLVDESMDKTVEQNKQFIQMICKSFQEENVSQFSKMSSQLIKMLQKSKADCMTQVQQNIISKATNALNQLTQFQQAQANFFFKYSDGILLQAISNGQFILLDELNLAPNEVLEYLEQILSNDDITIVDQQTNKDVCVKKHPNFRVFASMNPATDAGKKQLSQNLLSHFTVLNLEEMHDQIDLQILCESYLNNLYTDLQSIVELFIQLKQLSRTTLKTTNNQNPVYSIRLFCRALKFALYHHRSIIITRALYEGFHLYFTSNLDAQSTEIVVSLIKEKLKMASSFMFTDFMPHMDSLQFLFQSEKMLNVIDNIYFPAGPDFTNYNYNPAASILENQSIFVLTESNRQYIKIIVKALLAKTSILLEGVTSSGKSSLVLFLAKQLGYNVIRINNHENVDLQDYLGSFQPDSKTGQLKFVYGPLVRAMKTGSWVILDELNLCSSEILESLNRLLDDNGELYLAETNETIKPAPGFALFATQNPSGLVNGQYYGGRKQLSEAFKNRFVVMEIAEISVQELKFILSKRQGSKNLTPKFIELLVSICQQLKLKLSHTLASYQADLVSQQLTLRDLFRIADRLPTSLEELGMFIFMLVGEKQRSQQLKSLVIQVIRDSLKIDFSEEIIQNYYLNYSDPIIKMLSKTSSQQLQKFKNIVFTPSFIRQFALTMLALRHLENPCLIGDCGSGKTQVAELCAAVLNLPFNCINLHKNTDVSDMVGQLRPIRNRSELQNQLAQYKQLSLENPNVFYTQQINHIEQTLNQLFKWYDGPLVEAMQQGTFLLIDEISLANDAILERLNSVFETIRELTLSEKPEFAIITASNKFRVVSTMNPGGDYGKKELSPALRNRMTEIYVEAINNENEVRQIIQKRGNEKLVNNINLTDILVKFFTVVKQLSQKYCWGQNFTFSIRDLVSIFDHIQSQFTQNTIEPQHLMNSLQLCFLDGLQMRCQLDLVQCSKFQQSICKEMVEFLNYKYNNNKNIQIVLTENGLQFNNDGELQTIIKFGPKFSASNAELLMQRYNLNAPTTAYNALRVALAITNETKKPVLLESSPGVGKTTLIAMLADVCGYELVRVNLSEHIDLGDLLGSDLPVDDENCNEIRFHFIFGPVTRAIINDQWLLLDELNLASQSVLEGLNSLLDHRKELYIPEVNQIFKCGNNFRLFGAQNPYFQGGGRKQLPQSFLNRFICIYLQPLLTDDYTQIVDTLDLSDDIKKMLLAIIFQLQTECNKTFGFQGGDWEINLRDIFRIYDGMKSISRDNVAAFVRIVSIVLTYRFRNQADIQAAFNIIQNQLKEFNVDFYNQNYPLIDRSQDVLKCGHIILPTYCFSQQECSLMMQDVPLAESLMFGIQNNISVLFTTSKQQGYRADRVLYSIASLLKQKLNTISLAQSTDITDLIGQFEQLSYNQLLQQFINLVNEFFNYFYNVSFKSMKTEFDNIIMENASESNEQIHNIFCKLKAVIDKYNISIQNQNEDYALRINSLVTESMNITSKQNESKFVWKDGIITQAVEKGEWLYLQNVNFCQASVLDRLNSLLERGGCLYLYEQGKSEIRKVNIHKNFRIFMTYDSSFGEISRAIRNRCLEVCVDNFDFINCNLFGKQAEPHTHIDNQMICRLVQSENYLNLSQCLQIDQMMKFNMTDAALMQMLMQLFEVTPNQIEEKKFKLLNQSSSSARAFVSLFKQLDKQNNFESIIAIIQTVEFIYRLNGNVQQAVQVVLHFLDQNLTLKADSLENAIEELINKFTIKKPCANQFINQLQTLEVPFKSALDKLIFTCISESQKSDELGATLFQLCVNGEKFTEDDLRIMKMIVDGYYLQGQITQYTKSLFYQSFQRSDWVESRKQIGLANYLVTIEQNTNIVDIINKNQIKFEYGRTSYNKQSNKIEFVTFELDCLHGLVKQIMSETIPNSMTKQLLINLSLYNSNIKEPKAILDSPCTQYCVNNLNSISKTRAIQVTQKQKDLKEIYNTMMHSSISIFENKYQTICSLLNTQEHIIQQLTPNYQYKEITKDLLTTNFLDITVVGIKNAIKLFQFFDPNNQLDPAQHKQNQLDAIQDIIKVVESSLYIFAEQQIFIESRKQDNYADSFIIFQKLISHVQQYQSQHQQIESEAIKRTMIDNIFFYELQEKICQLNISDISELFTSKLDHNQIKCKLEQFRQASFMFITQIQSNIPLMLSYFDVILPVVYSVTNILVLGSFYEHLTNQKQQLISDQFVNAYFSVSSPFIFRQYLLNQKPKLQQQLDDLVITFLKLNFTEKSDFSIEYLKNQLDFNQLAQIAAQIEQGQINEFTHYVNANSPFRTRLQSKTGADELNDQEDFDRQLSQMFDIGEGQLAQILKPDQKIEVQKIEEKAPAGIKFVTEIGRFVLECYSKNNYVHLDDNEHYQFMNAISQLMSKTIGMETIDDHNTYIMLLDLLKSSHLQLQHQTTFNASILQKIKSHTTRRSQACKNIYKYPYPGEVYQFVSTKVKLYSDRNIELIKQFEENAKLQQIQQTIELVNDIQLLEQPLVKALSILEALVSLILEWNGSAPKIYQYSDELLQTLKTQITHWRRVELMSWNTFFDDIQIEQEDLSLVQWPELLIGALTAANRQVSAFSLIQSDFVQQFRQFLYYCDIGQFQIRRDLMFAISQIVLQTNYESCVNVSSLLQELYNESIELADEVEKHIVEKQKDLKSQFVNQVRLFQWDERSFYTLRMDAKKSHKLVLQILRKYNEVFQTQMVQIIKGGKGPRYVINQSRFTDKIFIENMNLIREQKFQPQSTFRNEQIDQILLNLVDFHTKKDDFNTQQLKIKGILAQLYELLQIEQFDVKTFDFNVLLQQSILYTENTAIGHIICAAKKYIDVLGVKHADLQSNDVNKMNQIVYALLMQLFAQMPQQTIVNQTNPETKQLFIQLCQSLVQCSNVIQNIFKQYISQEHDNELQETQKSLLAKLNIHVKEQSPVQADDLAVISNYIALQKLIIQKLRSKHFHESIFTPLLQILNSIEQVITTQQCVDISLVNSIQQQVYHQAQQIQIFTADTYLLYSADLIDVFACIMKSGYMSAEKPQEDKKEKEQQQQQDGTGLADAQGEKDITEQVKEENLEEDDIIGNDNDKQDQEQEEDDKDNGMDMEQDFGGQLQDVEKDEEQEEQDENDLDNDLGDESLNSEQREDQDKRGADEDDQNRKDEQEKNEEQGQDQEMVGNEDQQEEQEISDKPEQNDIQYEQPDEDLQQYEEVQEQNVSMQTQNEEDINLSELFDEVFEEEQVQNEQDMQEESEIEKIEEIDQLFDEKQENEEEQNQEEQEISQPSIKEIELEDDEMKWNNDDDVQEKGFNQGQKQNKEEIEDEEDQKDKEDKDKENDMDMPEKEEKEQEDEKEDKKTNKKDQSLKDDKVDKEKINKRSDQKQKENEVSVDANPCDNESEAEKAEADQQNALEDSQNSQEMMADGKSNPEKIMQEDNSAVDDVQGEQIEQGSKSEPEQLEKPKNLSEILNYIKQDQVINQQANTLSERLKILLEPTLNSNLVGDFKSGKKLNLKKIIPFIASGFRKDKIWLRRTKPLKRTYKIIIAVDNSFSIQNSETVLQIIQSLAIVFKATKLAELGKICICKFGAEFQVLYEMSDVFNEQIFYQGVEKIDFTDQQSNFQHLLDGCGKIFESETFGSDQLQNILIVLSDGQVNEKQGVAESYRRLVHDLNVLPIFMLYDKKIFDQTSIQFKLDNGKRQIIRKAYLEDEYPLANYIVCGDVDNLIEILCSALVQFLQQVV